jgi:hypothetical protein
VRVDNIGAEIRPRTPWEAVDLGFAMASGWRWPIMRAWLLAVGIPAIAILGAGWEHPGWAIFVLWWLKPVFDRVALFVVSRKLFGGDVRLMTVLGNLRGLFFYKGLIGSLTLRRLSFARSVELPVRQLEGSRGVALKKRLRIMMQGRSGRSGANLSIACILLEVCLTLSFVALLELLVPGQLIPWDQVGTDRVPTETTNAILRTVFVAYFIALSWIEPVFVSGGFGLYINHRSFLEGWDVQFSFEELGRRAKAMSQGAGRIASGILVAGMVAFSTTAVADASALVQDPDPRETAKEIAELPDFDTTEVRQVWHQDDSEFACSCAPDGEASAFGGMLGGFGPAVEILIWVLIAALVLAIVFFSLKALNDRRLEAQQRTKPKTVFGLDVTPESLPDDLPGEALALWRAGDVRGCLSLLYRGAITHLIDQDELFIEESDTERDCLRRVESRLEATRFQYFGRLTEAWQRCAYGRMLPQPSEAEMLISLWSMHFDPNHTAADASPEEVTA